MTSSTPVPSRDDVLNAFTVEPESGRATLERYLAAYPQYAEELVDLSHELSRVVREHEMPLAAEEQSLIEVAWERHLQTRSPAFADPLAALSVANLREIARRLDLPRQIIAAFRERKVIAESVPPRVFVSFAAALNTTAERLLSALALPAMPTAARSYKSDVKPQAGARVTFEQLLIDAGVPDEKRAMLMAEDE